MKKKLLLSIGLVGMSVVSASSTHSPTNIPSGYFELIHPVHNNHQHVLNPRQFRDLNPVVEPASRGRSNSFTNDVQAAVQADLDNRGVAALINAAEVLSGAASVTTNEVLDNVSEVTNEAVLSDLSDDNTSDNMDI